MMLRALMRPEGVGDTCGAWKDERGMRSEGSTRSILGVGLRDLLSSDAEDSWLVWRGRVRGGTADFGFWILDFGVSSALLCVGIAPAASGS